jgi:hypothetical protein
MEAKKVLRKMEVLKNEAKNRGFEVVKVGGRSLIVHGTAFTDEDLTALSRAIGSRIGFSVVPVKPNEADVVPKVEILLVME